MFRESRENEHTCIVLYLLQYIELRPIVPFRVVRLLLHHQNDVILDEDEDSNTPLHLACTHGHLGVAKVLVEADADVEPRWDTPLHPQGRGGAV